MRRSARVLALGFVLLLALFARALTFPVVFPGDGEVGLESADGAYHARRAHYSFVHFPAVLSFDPYLSYPDGSPAPWPPLYDWALGGTARLFGESFETFERVIAWAAPVLGALTVVPVFFAGRLVGGTGLGLGASALFAVLPAGVLPAQLGNPDHHAAVALLATTLLALGLAMVRTEAGERRLAALAAALLLARAALLLSWSGSLLYVALGDGSLLLTALVVGRSDLLRAQAWSALGSAALVLPWVATAAAPLGGPVSTLTLSWFHVLVLLALAGLTSGIAWLEPRLPRRGPLERLVLAACLGLALLAVLFWLPPLREALAPALAFLSKTDSWADRALEARSLYAEAPPGALFQGHPPSALYGWLAYAIPLTPLAVLARWRFPALRAPAVCLGCWTLVLAALAVSERRFGGDFAPVASIGFCLLLDELRRPLARRHRRLAAAGILALALLLLWPSLSQVYQPRVRQATVSLRDPERFRRVVRSSPKASLRRFARSIRDLTPETSGYLDPGGAPEYGILCQPTVGHALRYLARRPTSVDNFGPYLDAEKFDRVTEFYLTDSEARAVEIAEQLRARYVLSIGRQKQRPAGSLGERLQRDDGSARGALPHLERLRLFTEGPPAGRPLFPVPGRTPVVPYKLYELVEGAVLEVEAGPGTPVQAMLELETPLGRTFVFRARGRGGADGVARLRVPYASRSVAPTRAKSAYRVRFGGTELAVAVSDSDVATGTRIRVPKPR